MMDSQTVMAAAERCAEAYRRGYERGHNDNAEKYFDSAPLSGEWAGYSPIELLGDLFNQCDQEWFREHGFNEESSLYWSDLAEMAEAYPAIEDHYELGYRAAFNDDDIVLCAGCDSVIHRDQVGSSFVTLDSGERDYFCSDYCVK